MAVKLTKIVVIDVETTGILDTDKLIELASVRFDTEGEILQAEKVGWYSDTWEIHSQALFNPGIPIPPIASAIHHITDKDVVHSPVFSQNDWEAFTDQSEILASHNWGFDSKYVPKDPRPAICTWKCALRLWSESPSYSNQCLRYYLGLQPNLCGAGYPHRALYDAIVTTALLKRILEEKTIDELVTISLKPALLTRVKFGKYNGKAWSDVPQDYLNWVINHDFDENMKFTANYWLGNK